MLQGPEHPWCAGYPEPHIIRHATKISPNGSLGRSARCSTARRRLIGGEGGQEEHPADRHQLRASRTISGWRRSLGRPSRAPAAWTSSRDARVTHRP